ncbi:hypothetical protein QYE76_059788 [Lolium multiflorum]|uniref:Uncharacterized protein n=1 Tax=Lolium multiflorum TaxID=4521 RepID=A0AAD8RZ97_LOLMU|nr:hypothetical protein QYE76_059788 [Lolium multiflorum]
MSGHAKKLSDLGIVIPNKLGIHRVLQSLPPSYKNFVMNYNVQNMNKELPELFSMLKSAEVEIQKEHQVLMVNKITSFKKQGKPKKGNFKKGSKKVAAPPEKPKAGPKPIPSAITARRRGTGSGIAPSTWLISRAALSRKRKMDVKTAFLNGDIEEELYMVQPKGFVDPKNADKKRVEGVKGVNSDAIYSADLSLVVSSLPVTQRLLSSTISRIGLRIGCEAFRFILRTGNKSFLFLDELLGHPDPLFKALQLLAQGLEFGTIGRSVRLGVQSPSSR